MLLAQQSERPRPIRTVYLRLSPAARSLRRLHSDTYWQGCATSKQEAEIAGPKEEAGFGTVQDYRPLAHIAMWWEPSLATV